MAMHPPGSYNATHGYTAVWFRDGSVLYLPPSAHGLLVAALASERPPRYLTLRGRWDEKHLIMLDAISNTTQFEPTQLAQLDADLSLYEDEGERKPWE